MLLQSALKGKVHSALSADVSLYYDELKLAILKAYGRSLRHTGKILSSQRGDGKYEKFASKEIVVGRCILVN